MSVFSKLPFRIRLAACLSDLRGWMLRRKVDAACCALWNSGYYEEAEPLRKLSDQLWDTAALRQFPEKEAQ